MQLWIRQMYTNKCDDELIKVGSANNRIKGCGNVYGATGNIQFMYVLHGVTKHKTYASHFPENHNVLDNLDLYLVDTVLLNYPVMYLVLVC